MTYADYLREPFVPFEVLDRLTAAGLGDIPQRDITRAQFTRAMCGATLLLPPKRRPGRPTAPKTHSAQTLDRWAAQMRERNLTRGKGCRSIARAIEKRTQG